MIYNFVNEKRTKDGKLHRAFRNSDNPKDCYVEINGKIKKVESIREYWAKQKWE